MMFIEVTAGIPAELFRRMRRAAMDSDCPSIAHFIVQAIMAAVIRQELRTPDDEVLRN